ncbi:MAG: lipopolysaccharide biosynthesis protein [Sphingobacteriaceae bacterium]|nr:MAG: lipopolysaccharide biosynthesis protein [Sphingobacteriaceae bacterium]
MRSMLSKIISLARNKYILSLAGNVIMSGFGLLTMTLIYRSLSKTEAGTWVLFQSTLLLVDTFRSGFLTTAFIKFYAGATKERTEEVAGSAWLLGLAITGILVLVSVLSLFFLHYISDEGLALFFKWSGVYYAISLPWFLATCVIQGDQHFGKLLYIRLSNQGSFIVFIIIMIITGHMTLHNVLYAYLTSNAITSIYALLKNWTRITNLRNRSVTCAKEIYNFGKYSVGTNISATLLGTADSLIINFMLGPSTLAIYDAGIKFIQFIEIPLRSFAATAMPVLSTAFNSNRRDEVIKITKKYIGIVTIGLIPVMLGTLLFANEAILILGGEKYVHTEAPNILRIIMIIALFYPADRFLALSLDVIHLPKINFYKVMVMVLITVVTDFLAIYFTKSLYGVVIATILPTIFAIFS